MLNIMFGIVGCVIGIPILVCTAYVVYEFVSDVID